MRALLMIPLLLAAGCGESGTEEKKASRAASVEAGQWELTSEVTGLTSADSGAPAINTPVGTRATQSVCISGEGRAPAELFSGEGYACTFNNYYFRNGRINTMMSCTRDGLQGNIAMSIDGTFETGELSFTRDIRTSLATDGDVVINERVTGRRTGECVADVDPAANKAAAE